MRFDFNWRTTYKNEIFSILWELYTHEPISLGKRDSPHNSTTGFSENIIVTETNYQMLKVLSYVDQERASSSVIKITVLSFFMNKRKMKLSWVSIFFRIQKNTLSWISSSFSWTSVMIPGLVNLHSLSQSPLFLGHKVPCCSGDENGLIW